MKVFGIGLNKTGTKTLGHHLRQLGLKHRTYDSCDVKKSASFELWQAGRIDELLTIMEQYDSCEDWPWPLVYRDLDKKFPDAKFILTVRKSEDIWYRSLCNMAVRIGPLPLFEKSVYGSTMPHGRKAQHIEIYRSHNDAVAKYFANRPEKLLRLCWDDDESPAKMARFLGYHDAKIVPVHVNRSPGRIYNGDSLARAHLSRVIYQTITGPKAPIRHLMRAIRSRIAPHAGNDCA